MGTFAGRSPGIACRSRKGSPVGDRRLRLLRRQPGTRGDAGGSTRRPVERGRDRVERNGSERAQGRERSRGDPSASPGPRFLAPSQPGARPRRTTQGIPRAGSPGGTGGDPAVCRAKRIAYQIGGRMAGERTNGHVRWTQPGSRELTASGDPGGEAAPARPLQGRLRRGAPAAEVEKF